VGASAVAAVAVPLAANIPDQNKRLRNTMLHNMMQDHYVNRQLGNAGNAHAVHFRGLPAERTLVLTPANLIKGINVINR
jgi:hypothetical protein